MKSYTKIREFELSAPTALSEEQLAALSLFESQVNIQGTSKAGEYRIQATSWVGDILLPGMVLTIEPKIGPSDLLRLLLLGDGEATPRWVNSILSSQNTLWDLIGELLNSEIKRLAQHGLAKSYIEREDNLISPNGQIVLYQDFVENFPVRKGIYCRYTEFSEDIPKNRALKWALNVLGNLVSTGMHLNLIHTGDLLSSVELPPDLPEFDTPSKNDPYRFPLFLVDLIKRFGSVASGRFGFQGNGYLLNMNDVFEGYIRNQLRKSLKTSGIDVAPKGNINRNLCEGVRLEPDIILCDNRHNPIAVADCKYKRDWNKINSDVYQMLAYLEGYSPVQKAIVLFPTSSTELSVSKVDLPRSRILYSIGIPETKLLSEKVWQDIQDLIGGTLNDSKVMIA